MSQQAPKRRTRSTRRPKRKRRGGFSWRIFTAIILFIIAGGLLLADPLKNYMIKRGQETNVVTNITREQIQENKKREVTFNFNDVKTLNAFDVIKENVNPKDLPTIGGIAIPSVGINLPIYYGVTNEGMYLGATTLLPDQEMGKSNYPLASHHSIHPGLLFQPLQNVKKGDFVYLTDLDKVYKYEVHFIETVDPTRLDLIEPTEEAIVTLITCDSSLVYRVVVQARLVDEKPINAATGDMIEAFKLPQTVPTN